MVKRFCDTEIWNKEWFLELPIKQKLLTKFIFDNCDCAGIYEISWRLLKFYFNEEITKEDFKKIKQVKFINENTIFIEDFVLFQCSINSLKDLNPNNNAHKGIIKRLEKYNFLLAPTKPLTSPSLGAHRGAQEKEKEKEKEIKKENTDLFVSPEIEKTFSIYQEHCPNLCKLSFERRNMDLRKKIEDFLFEIRGDMTYFTDVCKKANKIRFIAEKRMDFKSLINNHIGIMNGKYEKPPDKAEDTKKEYPYAGEYKPFELSEKEKEESEAAFQRLFMNRSKGNLKEET